ncbi:MAG: glycine--tRNA ligase subunit beta [Anaerolineales bacterium]
MKPAPTFQAVLFELQRFWAGQGCVLWQPYYAQLGAGTMNPATFLRVLGPEPWRVAYVEPTIRPDDGRYGENPNRMQQHYQFQVILKPDPGNPQEIYLESLRQIGIEPKTHDLRFVEDNWESPALGAWGLGWEVWLDGLEITQYTYFQQAGGQVLDPVSVEITYGIDRIVMALQGVRHFSDVGWNETVTYGELHLDGEREHSAYYFEAADVERTRRLYEEFEAEAQAALGRGLLLPAYDFLLRCSHTFNVLDTRGVIGVTERAVFFGRMRDIARRIAEEHLARRAKRGFPLGVVPRPVPTTILGPVGSPLSGPAALVLEIGTEELPYRDAAYARSALKEAAPRLLSEHGLEFGGVQVLGTPRRLAVLVDALKPTQKSERVTEKGPPANRAFDAEGRPTAAALGWARKHGVDVDAESLRARIRDAEGGRYLFVEKTRGGDPAAKVLRESVLPELASELRFERGMRWLAQSPVTFSRPVRWLLAMHGDRPVPFEFAGLVAGTQSRGLRWDDPPEIRLGEASQYSQTLKARGVILDPEERKALIQTEAARLAGEVQGSPVQDEELLDEVVDLVESPAVVRGRIDEEYLVLPRPVLMAVMKKYQRYFALEREGSLLPYFLAVANGRRPSLDTIRGGNENVLRARFADAAYFVRRDLEESLEAYRARLASILFHSKRGTMLDKSDRVLELVGWVGTGPLQLEPPQVKVAQRAAFLAQADLATRMVVEITSLHGEIGREYALRSGEPADVAQAISEHVLPRAAGDRLPDSGPGTALAIADRLDTLAALFSLGQQATGTRDPLGLRRTGIGLIQILIGRRIHMSLVMALDEAARGLKLEKGSSEGLAYGLTFLLERLRSLLLAKGHRVDVVEAVLAEGSADPFAAATAVEELETWSARGDWPATLQAFARCQRIQTTGDGEGELDPTSFTEEAERELHRALVRAERAGPLDGSPAKFLTAFQPMVPAITRFFEDVLVMDERPAVRQNRLRLLGGVVRLAAGVADLSKLEGF